MAGGTWETQNKSLNGAYINVLSNSLVTRALESRGTPIIPLALKWGDPEGLIEVTPTTDFLLELGSPLSGLKPVREGLKGNGKLLIYNLTQTSEKAKLTLENSAEVTAIKQGVAGNDIKVSGSLKADGITFVYRETFGGVTHVTEHESAGESEQVNLTGRFTVYEGALVEFAETSLTGGSSETPTVGSWGDMLKSLDNVNFKTFAVPTDDEDVKNLVTAQVKIWRDERGKKVTAVMPDYSQADYEGVVSIVNGVTLPNESITKTEAVYWYAAAYANAATDSLTYAEYPGAIDCERMTFDEMVKAKETGNVFFSYVYGMDGIDRVVVESDINTLHNFTPKKNQDFRKGKIVRQLDIIHDNIKHIWEKYFIGKVTNNTDGRNLFKAQVFNTVLAPMVQQGAIEPVGTDDMQVFAGAERDAVRSELNIQPNDAMEKLYMNVNI